MQLVVKTSRSKTGRVTETSSVYRLAMFPTLIFKWISAAHPAYILSLVQCL